MTELAGVPVGDGDRTLVIAEAGVNHNGDVETARELVDAAAEAGADAVKFQTFQADRLVSPAARKADYQEETTEADESQRAMLADLELEGDAFADLRARARDRGLVFLSSPFDRASVHLLDGMGLPAIKVPSGEITNTPYLRAVGSTGKPAILSTGMSHLDEVGRAVRVLEDAGTGGLILLHCLSEYPAPSDEVNLRAMDTLREAFGVPVGFSDHTLGTTVAVAAVARGADIVEKHFTLDRSLEGPDHEASLEPDELEVMIEAIRTTEAALGEGRKRPMPAERDNRAVVRKSLGLAEDKPAGTKLERGDLVPLRPGRGLPPSELDRVVGRELALDKPAGSILSEDDLR